MHLIRITLYDSITDQIPNTQQLLKLLCHWIMLHSHEDSVEDDADGDGEVHKWIHNNDEEPLLEPSPTATTVPLQEDVSERIPTWRTRPLVILKF